MTRSPARRAVALVLALALGVVVAVSSPERAQAAAPQVNGTETDLGVQIPGRSTGLRSEQSAQGVLANGKYLTYFVNSGGPGTAARFFAMDLTGAKVAEVTVPHGTSIMTLVYSAATTSVFFAANTSSSSYLYEWNGSTLNEVAVIADHAVMRLAPAPDGPVYIGTFAPSNGRLFVYSGGVLTDLGQPIAGESYVRSLVADSTSVWLSNYRESAAKLVRMNRATRAKTVIATPAAFAAEWSALDMSRAGNLLFLRMVNRPLLFAYNTVTGKFDSFDDQVARERTSPEVPNVTQYIDGISPYGISPLVEGKYVYFQRSGAGIMRIDVTNNLKTIRVDKWNGTDNPNSWPSASVPGPVSYAWLSGVGGRAGYSLVTTTIDAKVYVNTPGQTAPLIRTLQAQDAPSTINRLGVDGAGIVYSGGFDLPAGVSAYSSAAGKATLLDAPQIEGFGTFNTSMVMGGYTGDSTASAPLYLYSGSGQPQLKTYLNNSQERPVALVQLGSKVIVGSVPIKNTLGGALSIWDPTTNALTVKRNIIPNHSIISLSTYGGLVVGGSSNTGGTGSTPTASDGKIFTYNVSTGALKTFAPPRAVSATYSWVAAITPDPTQPGRFWAISTGYLIQFEVASDGRITLTKNLGAFPNTSSPTGKELGISFVGSTLFATIDQGLAAINTMTGETTMVAQKTAAGPVVGLVRTGTKALYYARGANLYRYVVDSASTSTLLAAPQITSPDLTVAVAPGSVVFEGTGTKNSTVEVSDGSRTRSALVRDDGTWSLASMDFAPGSHELTFTASLAGFASQVTRVTLTVSTTASNPCVFVEPVPTNVVIGGYNPPNKDYAFAGTGTPGTTITMVSGSRTRSATVRADGTWSMNPVWFGWWAGTVPFTASLTGCPSVTNVVMATFATKPSSHVPPLLISHTTSDFYSGGEVVFKGKGTPGAMITLLVGNQIRFAAVSTTGRWTMRSVTVSEAPVTLSLASTVPDYPEQRATVDVHFGTAPTSLVAPLLSSHSSATTAPAGDVVFSGKGTPRSKISLTVGYRTVSAFVRANGRWDLPPISVSPGSRTLAFTASSPGLVATVTTKTVTFA